MGTLPQQEGLPPLRSPGCDNQVGGPNPFLQRVGKGGRGVGDRRTNQPPFAIAVGKGGWEAQRQRGGGPQATRGTRLSNTGNHTRQASKGRRGYPEPLTVYAGSESVVSRFPKRPFRDQEPRHTREESLTLLTVTVHQSEIEPEASLISRQPAATRPVSTPTRRDAWGRSQVQDTSVRDQT